MSRQNKLSTKPYKGTRDFYPEDMRFRRWMFGIMRHVAESFGYEEYDGPLLESFELYAAKSGEELVNEQLYHFHDRGNRHVAIRPEMTPTAARMVAGRLQQLSRPIRWFSIPNLWRYEKPQRGRLREHWQFNVDIFGIDAITADFEIIELAITLVTSFGARPGDFRIFFSNRRLLNEFLGSTLELDSRGAGAVCKAIDKQAKVPRETFLYMLEQAGLSREKITRLETFLSSDWKNLEELNLTDSQGFKELNALFSLIRSAGLSDFCQLDLSIVRGLDYYTGTVFEMFDLNPENRRAMFGGGRYDDLLGLFGKEKIPGVGFGMGDVILQNFLETHRLVPELPPPFDILVALFDASLVENAFRLARRFRASGLRTLVFPEAVKLGKQFKTADQKRIPVVAVQGPDELKDSTITLKFLTCRKQLTVPLDEAVRTIREQLEGDC